ncbi:MAG TPA: inositol monophosphatase [Verrucomicrobiae bacterium]|nr:inositol monophosphatase [Verrucomicrobiae bacterium]
MNYGEELGFAKDLAREAGKMIRDAFVAGVTHTWKADSTPLTETDEAINALVIQRVTQAFPDHGVIGEEGNIREDKKLKWVCDPIDGTMSFSHGVQVSTFALALTDDAGQPVVAVIYDPYMDRLFSAVKGEGAFLNDRPIHVSDQTTLEHALIEADAFPSTRPVIDADADLFNVLRSKGAYVTSTWSVILLAGLVAAGHYAAALLNVDNCHDAAAPKLIVEEAGGKVTDLQGNDQRYDQSTRGFIASNGHIHAELVKLLSSYDLVQK